MPHRSAPWIALVACTWWLAGCNSTGLAPISTLRREPAPARGLGGRLFSPPEQIVAANAVRQWHHDSARAGQVYALDRYDRRLSHGFRQSLRDICPPLPADFDPEDPALITLTIEQVELPQPHYAYAVLRAGNRFETAEHAYVYALRDQQWILLDHYLVAAGLMEAALLDFSWPAYCREKRIPLETAVAGTATRP